MPQRSCAPDKGTNSYYVHLCTMSSNMILIAESGRRLSAAASQERAYWPHPESGGIGTGSGCVRIRPGCVPDASGF